MTQQIAALTNGRISHQRHPVRERPRQKIELDPARLEIVKNLVRCAAGLVEFVEIGHVEVGNSPAADLAFGAKFFEGLDGFFQRRAAAPMQQIKIDHVRPQSTQAARAGFRQIRAAGVMRINFGHEKDVLAPARDRLPHHFLGRALSVHLRRIDQRHPELDSEPQGGHFLHTIPFALAHFPRPLPEGGHGCLIGQRNGLHHSIFERTIAVRKKRAHPAKPKETRSRLA